MNLYIMALLPLNFLTKYCMVEFDKSYSLFFFKGDSLLFICLFHGVMKLSKRMFQYKTNNCS
jgi:hypothetical protein